MFLLRPFPDIFPSLPLFELFSLMIGRLRSSGEVVFQIVTRLRLEQSSCSFSLQPLFLLGLNLADDFFAIPKLHIFSQPASCSAAGTLL